MPVVWSAARVESVVSGLVGPGSGSANGFLDYNNAGGPISLPAEAWATITNDGAGPFTNKSYGVPGVPEVMDPAGRLDFQYLEIGDGLLIRTDIQVTPTVNGATLSSRWNLGSVSPYSLTAGLGSLEGGAGVPVQVVFLSYVYVGDSNTADGFGELQLRCSDNAVAANAGSAIQIMKRGAG